MALIKSDRVKETSTSTGATTFALAGAGTGYRTFSSVCAIGDTFYYAISNQSNGEWEAGLGTYSALNTLTRTAVHSSSNSGNVVTFTSGTKEVFLTLTARHLDRINDNGQSTAIGSKTSVVAVNDSATLPDLDLQFSELKTLTAKYGPTPSYSRASTGRYTNASGVLTSATVNEPRFDHVLENGVWVSKGLLIEEQRTNSLTYSEDITNAIYVKGGVAISSNAAIAPDGTTTADLIYPTASTTSVYYNSFSGTSQYTASVFAKASGKSCFGFYHNDGANLGASFNLANGTVSNVFSGNSASIRNFGNGWYRCTITSPTTASYLLWQIFLQDSQGTSFTVTPNGTDGVLFWGAQRELGSFPTSYIPTVASLVTRSVDVCQITGSAFTNLWNATEGSFAVEYEQLKPLNIGTVVSCSDGGTNSVLYDYASEGNSGGIDYGPSFYIRNSGTFTVENSNSPISLGQQKYSAGFKSNDFAMSYLGRTVQTDTTVTLPTVNQMGIGKPLFAQYPFSGHISRLRYFRSRLDNTQLVNLSGGINTLAFKPVTGSGSVTVANEYSGINISVPNPLPITNGGTGAQTQLAAVTNLISNPPNDGGQYTLASKKTSGSPSFYWVDSTGYAPTLDLLFAADKSLTAYTGPTPSFSRASTGTFFNSSGTLTTAAINAPRFNHVYNGSSWVSKGLLVEEQRTNINLYSEQFNNAAYSINQGVVTANQASSPDGNTTAENLTASAGTVNPYVYMALATANSSVYTFSIYVKKNTHDFVQVVLNGVANGFANFNISSGVVGTLGAGGSATSSIVNVGNGWYRCVVTYTTATTSGNGFINLIGSATAGRGATFTAAGTESVYLWGQQLELGSFPTSYIPTTTAAVTRSADVCQITGTDFSSFWNASEGSFAAEYDRLFSASSITNASTVFQAFIDGSNNDRYALFHNSSGTVGERFNVTVGNAEYANLDSGLSISQTSGRSSTAYKVNDFALSVNGGAIVSDTSGPIVSSANKLNIGQMYGSNWLNGHIARLRYYPTRLPNATLQVLST